MCAGLFVLCLSQPAFAAIGAHILIDAKTGAVLDQKDATRLWYPASLTKIMTAYVTFKAVREGSISLQSPVIQSKNSLAEPPSKMGFKVGTQLTVEAALKIILIKSANDVSVALGEAVAGSEEAFIDLMNAEAARLGMADTRFVNPHGLPNNRQVSTARDMAILAQAFWRDFPDARALYKHSGIKFGKRTLRSANREYLLRVRGANGMKTGYICNSGYNVAATATRGGRTLIAVVLGAASGLERIAFTRELMDKGFKKRSGGPKVGNLARTGAKPPADGYCKRNAKPGAQGIMARFDMKKSSSRSLALSFSPQRDQGAVILPGASNRAEKVDTSDGITLPNGKTDWAKVLDRTIGPRLLAYKPIVVTTGVPRGGAVLARLPAASIPIPTAKPAGADAAPVVQTNAAAPGSVVQPSSGAPATATSAAAPAPGSLFRQGIGFAVPVPAPSPRK
ncbi:MAG: D-alanyl-D-alanine carboxypeptidase [Roseibium sp.]|nr:D-alanyl-D-alanine carboxypeptidase [Roseibium sp.]